MSKRFFGMLSSCLAAVAALSVGTASVAFIHSPTPPDELMK
ncbi:AgrD family cyclic lactone autoinducer peptide [Paenibacillus sp. 1-18]|nr:cyclic lactone autoinducer peptide [Paenibacillus sp. 1-18]